MPVPSASEVFLARVAKYSFAPEMQHDPDVANDDREQRGDGSTADPHGGHAEPTEDQYRRYEHVDHDRRDADLDAEPEVACPAQRG